jgi:Uma2 family endonuclease
MTANPNRVLMSVNEYLELDRNALDTRYEFIDGVVTMMAGGTADHSTISINVISALRGLLRASQCRVYNSDLRIRLTQSRYVYPDASISCNVEDRGQIDIIQSPCVVIEVLSPSTEAYDRGRKFAYYRACPTLQEYVLVDTQRQAVDLYRRATDNLWTFHPFGPGETVMLKSINVSVPMDAFYENVTFPEDTL